MSDIAIRVENLSKQYQIGEAQPRYYSLREQVADGVKRLLSRSDRDQEERYIWALKDVSFDVKQGEVLGIIGRNGAGKSTLLKILSQITEPTEGRALIYGRVGSLLEVGTGFHPELTGRENVFLNGTILGMTKAEIDRKFDEIVDFSGVEKFIDTPVKRYSSGMQVRLAFAVAAHLEPEILLVDEVLAVGDIKFQEKSLGKMNDVARSGRTVLFVSHNMVGVQQLCSRGIVVDRGAVEFDGATDEAIMHYMSWSEERSQITELLNREDRKGEGSFRFTHIEICNDKGEPINRILSGKDIRIRLHYVTDRSFQNAAVLVAFNVYNQFGILLTNLNTLDVGKGDLPVSDAGYFECRWSRFNLRSGVYTCTVFCSLNGIIQDWMQAAFRLFVEDGNYYGTGSIVDRSQGDLLVDYDWSSRGKFEHSV